MLLPVAFVLHLIVPLQPMAVKTAVSVLHKLVLFELINGVAGLPLVLIINTLLEPLTPQRFSHKALYVPELLTISVVPVTFVFHRTTPLQPVAVKMAASLLHKIVLLELITGTLGLVPVRITITFDEMLIPQLLLHIAV